MKRRLFNIAWSIVDQFDSFADALVHAWKVIKLQFALCTQSLVRFKYIKVSDGSVREALGTLETVPMTKGTGKPVNYGILTYWDIQAVAWRSCQIAKLIF